MEKVKVGLLGFGQTGKLVAEEFLKESDMELSWVIRRSKTEKKKYAGQMLGTDDEKAGRIYSRSHFSQKFLIKHPVDMIVDFSSPSGLRLYKTAADAGIPIISAISHYTDAEIEKLKKISEKTAVLYSPNITLGVNLMMMISQILQKIIPHADIEIVEEHFKGKEGISGTAKKMASLLSVPPESVHSLRLGKTVGKHMIAFGMPNQTLTLIHESTNRAAFGQGAIFAVRHMMGRESGIYSMEQMIQKMFQENIPVY